MFWCKLRRLVICKAKMSRFAFSYSFLLDSMKYLIFINHTLFRFFPFYVNQSFSTRAGEKDIVYKLNFFCGPMNPQV